jgi:hypothetical protein
MDASQAVTGGSSSLIDFLSEELHLPPKMTQALKEVADAGEIVAGSMTGDVQMTISGASDLLGQVASQIQAAQGKTEYATSGSPAASSALASTPASASKTSNTGNSQGAASSSSQMMDLLTKLIGFAASAAGAATGTSASTSASSTALTAITNASSSAAKTGTTAGSTGSSSSTSQLVAVLTQLAASGNSTAQKGLSAVNSVPTSSTPGYAAIPGVSVLSASTPATGTSSSNSDMMLFLALLEANSQTTSTSSTPLAPAGSTSSTTGTSGSSAGVAGNATLTTTPSIGSEILSLLESIFPQLSSGTGTTSTAGSTNTLTTASTPTVHAATPVTRPTATKPASTSTPADPKAAQRLQALQTLSTDYSQAEIAGSWTGSHDNKLGMEDLQAISSNPSKYPSDLVNAANYFIQNPSDFSSILTTDSAYASSSDVAAALAKATAAQVTPAATSTSASSTNSAIDPLADQRVSAFQILRQDFTTFDTAGAFMGFSDGTIGMNDMQAIVRDNSQHADVKAAAQFFIDNPSEFKKLADSDGVILKSTMDNAYTQALATQKTTDAAKAALTATPAASPSSSAAPTVAPASSSSSLSVPNSTTDIPSQMQQVLANPNLSIDEKVEQILMLSQQDADNDVIDVAQKMQDDEAKKKGLSTDSTDQSQLSDVNDDMSNLNTQLQDALQRKQAMTTLLSNFIMKEGETAMTAINNIAQ